MLANTQRYMRGFGVSSDLYPDCNNIAIFLNVIY